MAQLDPSRYKRLTKALTYGQSDGLYWDGTNSRLVASVAGTVYEAPLQVAAQASGDILLRSASTWVRAAPSGDLSVAAGGAVTLADPMHIYTATLALTEALIVGNAAGDIGHTDGAELVANVPGKIIEPVAVVINYTHDTAAYTAGGNLTAGYKDGGAATGLVSAANSFGAATSSVSVLRPLSGAALSNKAMVLRSSGAFTNPGTAAGTAVVTTYYRLIAD